MEEYPVVKRGKEYQGCGEESNVEKRKRGSNIISPVIMKLLSGKEGKDENFGGK